MNSHPTRRAPVIRHAAAALLLLAPLAQAFQYPVPPGGQVGTSMPIDLRGTNLDSFQELLTYQPGLSLSDITVVDPKHLKATLHIAPDAALGEHSLRIRTSRGISLLRSFWVGPFAALDEVEPNNTAEEAQRVELNTTVHGIIKTEDEDGFLVSLKKGQRLSVEAEAMRLGRVLFDAHLAIFDSRRFELAACDDAAFLRTDPFVSIIAPEDGDYRVVIREAAYQGGDQARYRLHIGTFPRPDAVSPLGGKPGETIDFTFIGDPAGPITQTVTLPSEPTESHFIFPVQNGETAPSGHAVTVSPLEHSSQSNQNFARESAHPFPAIPGAVHGIIDGENDSRWFKFAAKKGQNLNIRVVARNLRSPLDSVLTLRKPTGGRISDNDDQGGPDSVINWPCDADGEYFLEIRDQLKRRGPDYTFRIEINERPQTIAATLPVAERNNSQKAKVFPVPRGNRYATVIQLTRQNIGCDIEFSAEGLPPGITLHAPPVPKNLNSFPVILEAAADAPLGATLQAYRIRATGEKVPDVQADLADTIHHLEVNNQGTYHSVTLDRIATAVTEPAPFSIELEAPVVPLVKNGTYHLKLRVNRAEGFKEKITARLIWTPGGVSGPPNIDIAPDQTEATYEINANNDAVLGDWPICVTAEANTPHGPMTVATGFVTLKVAEPYLTFALDLAAAQVGKPAAMLAKIDQLREFAGQATAELVALPHGVSSSPVTFTKDQQEITFPLQLADDAKVGKHSGILCKVLIPENGQQVLHQTGHNGTIRVDPAPKAPEKPAAAPAAKDKPKAEVATAPAPPKPLSRLEQLRQGK